MRVPFKRRMTGLLGILTLSCCALLFGPATPSAVQAGVGGTGDCTLVCFTTVQNDTQTVCPGGVVGFCVKAAFEGDGCTGLEQIWLAMIARPSFLQPIGHTTSGPGEWATLCLVERICRDVCPGTYWAKFQARDTVTGESVFCNVRIVVQKVRHRYGCGCKGCGDMWASDSKCDKHGPTCEGNRDGCKERKKCEKHGPSCDGKKGDCWKKGDCKKHGDGCDGRKSECERQDGCKTHGPSCDGRKSDCKTECPKHGSSCDGRKSDCKPDWCSKHSQCDGKRWDCKPKCGKHWGCDGKKSDCKPPV
jgi:hypothetical protein